MKIRIDIPGYQDIQFSVVAQCVYPCPVTMPRDPSQLGSQPQQMLAMRDVFICKMTEDIAVVFDNKFWSSVMPIGRERLLFAVPPEALLDIITHEPVADCYPTLDELAG